MIFENGDRVLVHTDIGKKMATIGIVLSMMKR